MVESEYTAGRAGGAGAYLLSASGTKKPERWEMPDHAPGTLVMVKHRRDSAATSVVLHLSMPLHPDEVDYHLAPAQSIGVFRFAEGWGFV